MMAFISPLQVVGQQPTQHVQARGLQHRALTTYKPRRAARGARVVECTLGVGERGLSSLESASALLEKGPQHVFESFFDNQSGSWNSARTYHYPVDGEREDSNTTFDVERLSSDEIDKVLEANGDAGVQPASLREKAQGFRVSFLTKMQSQEELVRNHTELAFIPTETKAAIITGKYYRLIGYEESGPKKADFLFDAAKQQLIMITTYTRVVAVDEITLTNPAFRVRKIINYKRPENDDEPLTTPVLVGFGVENKRADTDPKLVDG